MQPPLQNIKSSHKVETRLKDKNLISPFSQKLSLLESKQNYFLSFLYQNLHINASVNKRKMIVDYMKY